jgi:hypothetical protein
MNNINEKTKVELFAALTAMPFIVGLIFWLSAMNNSANGSEKKIAELEQRQQNQNNLLISIKEDLTLVKYKLDIKGNKKDE